MGTFYISLNCSWASYSRSCYGFILCCLLPISISSFPSSWYRSSRRLTFAPPSPFLWGMLQLIVVLLSILFLFEQKKARGSFFVRQPFHLSIHPDASIISKKEVRKNAKIDHPLHCSSFGCNRRSWILDQVNGACLSVSMCCILLRPPPPKTTKEMKETDTPQPPPTLLYLFYSTLVICNKLGSVRATLLLYVCRKCRAVCQLKQLSWITSFRFESSCSSFVLSR